MSIITLDDFKAFFRRDFPFLPVFNVNSIYIIGSEVYYTNGLFYRSLVNSPSFLPDHVLTGNETAQWEQYTDSIDNYILDEDINKAFAEAETSFNSGLFSNQDRLILAYKYLTAHFLCLDIKTSKNGISGASSFNVNSRSVGSVSESYSIPQKFLDNPILSYLTSTNYGLKYLNMIYAYSIGSIKAIDGASQP